MRLPKQQQRLRWRGSVLVCLAIAGLIQFGCQGPELDRLDGSTTRPSTSDPIVDNGPPPTHPSSDANSAAQSSPQQSATIQAAIAENLNSGHREAALNHSEQAEAYYRKVLDLDPANPVANHRLAVLADRRSDFAASERCYLTALRREPNDPDLLSDLGYSYYLQGRTAEAERFLLSAVRINPQHKLALDNLSLLYAKLGDRDRTYEMLKRSLGDQEARGRLAQLFPPQGAPAAADDDTFTASFAPSSAHEAPAQGTVSAAPSLTPTAASDQPAAQTAVTASVPENRTLENSPVAVVPPAPAPPASPGPPTSETAPSSVAAAMPLPPMPSPTPTPTAAPSPPVGAAAQSPFEKQLADLMERERQRALEQRAQQQSMTAPPMPAVQPVAPSQPLAAAPTAQPVAQPALRPQPDSWSAGNSSVGTAAAPQSTPTSHVPDDRINDAFSVIDREGTGNALPSAPATDKSPRYEPSAPTPWSQSTSQATTALPPAQPVNRTAGVSSAAPNWPAISTDAPNRASVTATTNPLPATPTTIPPAAEPDPISTAASSSATVPAQPSAGTGKNGADQEFNPPAPQWQNAMNANPPEVAPSATPAAPAAPNCAVPAWQPDRSPRIVATNVTPSTVATPSAPPRTADALDEFESELQKNNPSAASGRSFSNSAVVAKPAVQPISHDQPAAANKPAAATDSSTAGVQPWSMRIQPRHDPPALFRPDDSSSTAKKPSADKPNGFEMAPAGSDVPQWPGASASGAAAGTSSSSDSGPTIRPAGQ